ncbi:alpha/beta fold hydrolase [Aspergillus undulatus]|uniref:alpha/beta fold hydrolase n=1 Tax=Aspergillus undulatus TaxID=1810928 RepID=UPI003CCDC7F4
MESTLPSPSPSLSASTATTPALPLNSTPTPALIPIGNGSHCLSCCVTGPAIQCGPAQGDADARKNNESDPLVVIIPGAGDVASSYVAVERLLRPFTKTLLYDRSGLGRSENRPSPVGAESGLEGRSYTSRSGAVTAAAELGSLLRALSLTSPLILLAHSYGGIVAREFFHLYPERVAGMVLVDASTARERVLLCAGPQYRCCAWEWRARAKDIYASADAATAETAGFQVVCKTLKSKKQVETQALGGRPLVVIRANTARDYERVYQAGIQSGNGTEEERQGFEELLGRWENIDAELQEEQLRLSSVNRFVRVQDCGHNVHLVRPDVIAEEVRWVRDRILERS